MHTSLHLAWPQLIPIDTSSRPKHSVPITAGFVQDLVIELEETQQPRRRSSFSGRAPSPSFRAYGGLQQISLSPSAKTINVGDSTLIRIEVLRGANALSNSKADSTLRPLVPRVEQAILGIYMLRPSPSEQSTQTQAGTSRPVSPNLEILPALPESPYTFTRSPGVWALTHSAEEMSPLGSPMSSVSPVALAVDSAADPIPVYKLDNGSAVSFNTSVRDLVQQEPDFPIGGKLDAPLDRSTSPSAIARMTGPTSVLSRQRPLLTRSNLSDPWQGPSRRDTPSSMFPEPSGTSEDPIPRFERPISPWVSPSADYPQATGSTDC